MIKIPAQAVRPAQADLPITEKRILLPIINTFCAVCGRVGRFFDVFLGSGGAVWLCGYHNEVNQIWNKRLDNYGRTLG